MFEKLTHNLTRLGYKVSCFATAVEAAAYLNREVDGVTIGMGGSVTLAALNLGESLGKHNTVYWHQGAKDYEESVQLRRMAATADVYLSSVNGISEDGEIINIDGNCNRVSATLWGHKRVIFVVGKNKVAPDYEAALRRARNIAAPLNARRLNRKTPCAVGDLKCHNCHSPERICRALTVLWEKPTNCDYEVVLINEELGY